MATREQNFACKFLMSYEEISSPTRTKVALGGLRNTIGTIKNVK